MAARPCEPTFSGAVYRQSSPRYAEISHRTLSASSRAGGRFNPPGEFGALYVSLDPETPLRELHRQAAQSGTAVARLLPRTLFAADVHLRRVADLGCDAGRRAWRLTDAELSADDWTRCQETARRIRAAGMEAIRFPSATGAGENLAVFLDRLGPGSFVRLLGTEALKPR